MHSTDAIPLEFVKFPEGMQEIGINVFANTKVIKYIEIPASVTEITDVFYFTASNNPECRDSYT